MSKTYLELCKELESLHDELDNETNDSMRPGIQTAIAEVKEEIDNYDLSGDDLFKCHACKKVYDIEISIMDKDAGQLICENCHNHLD